MPISQKRVSGVAICGKDGSDFRLLTKFMSVA